MPFYDYHCEKCKETFEVLQKVSDEPLTKCEKCEGPIQKVVNNNFIIILLKVLVISV